MKKAAILLLLTIAVYADNTDFFNSAYQIGKQNQFNFNLNENSSFDSFGQANKLESNIINGANSGNANAKSMHDGADKDPNYLYNQGKADIVSCQSKNDPRCTTLNKYGDKDTQTQFQAYNQGISSKYSIITKPDPSDSNCTQIIKKVPIGESTKSCISANKQSGKCNNTITPSFSMRCSSTQVISDTQPRPAEGGKCDRITVQLSCDGAGNYKVFFGVTDCTHSGYSSSTTKTFPAEPNQQKSDMVMITPKWGIDTDGCSKNPIQLNYNYICPISGDCLITFRAHCANYPSIYDKTFNYSSLTTKKYSYQFNQGCPNEKK